MKFGCPVLVALVNKLELFNGQTYAVYDEWRSLTITGLNDLAIPYLVPQNVTSMFLIFSRQYAVIQSVTTGLVSFSMSTKVSLSIFRRFGFKKPRPSCPVEVFLAVSKSFFELKLWKLHKLAIAVISRELLSLFLMSTNYPAQVMLYTYVEIKSRLE